MHAYAFQPQLQLQLQSGLFWRHDQEQSGRYQDFACSVVSDVHLGSGVGDAYLLTRSAKSSLIPLS